MKKKWYQIREVWASIVLTLIVAWMIAFIVVLVQNPGMALLMFFVTLMAVGALFVMVFLVSSWRYAYKAVQKNKSGQ